MVKMGRKWNSGSAALWVFHDRNCAAQTCRVSRVVERMCRRFNSPCNRQSLQFGRRDRVAWCLLESGRDVKNSC